jgi:hypothetical protein
MAPSFLDDVGILFVGEDDVKSFSRHIANLNVHYFSEEGRTASLSEITDPVSMSRRYDIRKRLAVSPIIVYKVGAKTDLTMGRFVRMRDDSPKGWYTTQDEEEMEEEEDEEEDEEEMEKEEMEEEEDEWLGVVEWMDDKFADSGDSGSLVFAREDGIHIPLGIHVGSPAGTRKSIFVSLETFCLAAEVEGLEPHFRY